MGFYVCLLHSKWSSICFIATDGKIIHLLDVSNYEKSPGKHEEKGYVLLVLGIKDYKTFANGFSPHESKTVVIY